MDQAETDMILEAHKKWEEITRLSEESLIVKLKKIPEDTPEVINYNPGRTGLKLEGVLTLLKSLPKLEPKFQQSIEFINHKYFRNLFLLIGEQENHLSPWSSQNNSRKCIEIIEEISRIFELSSHNLKEIVLRDVKIRGGSTKLTILYQVFSNLHSKLNSENWKFYPAAQQSYHWLLLQTKHPILGDMIDFVFPPSILFTEDYNSEHILVGISSLGHILRNITKNEILKRNRAELIFTTLNKVFSNEDPKVIDHLMPEMIKTLSILENNSPLSSNEFTRYDEVMKNILYPLEFRTQTDSEENIGLLKNWLRHLAVFLEVFGISALHWSDRIIGILREIIKCNDPTFLLLILECTQLCIKNTWPKLDADSLSEIIIKIVYNTSVSAPGFIKLKAAQRHMIYDKAQETFSLLMYCPHVNGEQIRTQMNEILNNEDKSLNPAFLSVLTSVVSPFVDGENTASQE